MSIVRIIIEQREDQISIVRDQDSVFGEDPRTATLQCLADAAVAAASALGVDTDDLVELVAASSRFENLQRKRTSVLVDPLKDRVREEPGTPSENR